MCPLACTALLALLIAPLAGAQDVEALTADTRTRAMPVLPKIAAAMKQAVEQEGPEAAIGVCKTRAPELLQEAARSTGWTMRRVSLKPRNAETALPDAWEARHLADFNIRAANGVKPETLEVGELVAAADGRQTFRYLRALPVVEVCQNCHGETSAMKDGIKARLKADYPHDRATGYSLGEVRGALSVRRPL
jgi:hypothetical protein